MIKRINDFYGLKLPYDWADTNFICQGCGKVITKEEYLPQHPEFVLPFNMAYAFDILVGHWNKCPNRKNIEPMEND